METKHRKQTTAELEFGPAQSQLTCFLQVPGCSEVDTEGVLCEDARVLVTLVMVIAVLAGPCEDQSYQG